VSLRRGLVGRRRRVGWVGRLVVEVKWWWWGVRDLQFRKRDGGSDREQGFSRVLYMLGHVWAVRA